MSDRERTFVDTNVLVYAYDSTDSQKQKVAKALLLELWGAGAGALSTQVLQEFYTVATRKLDPPLIRGEARKIVALYSTWQIVCVDVPLITSASQLEESQTLSFWDALVIQAARRVGATRLMTEDLQHGRQFGDLRIEDPFRIARDSIQ